MRHSKYAILVFLLFGFLTGFSQVYTVKNTNDNGVGSLRQGLLDVPANTPGYTINFDLPGDPADYANRTIRLRSPLPTVRSNVIIDGSSQASWPALGVSGAKVILEPEFPNTSFHGLVIGELFSNNVITSGVEIYGLYLRNFARINTFQGANGGSGIVIDYRASNIKIGANGKGNVIGGNMNGIVIQNSNYYNATALISISIQSNLIGVSYDGTTHQSNVTGISANLYDSSLNIGGDNDGDGNVISANQINVNISRNSYSSFTNRFEVNIVNNKIGTDFSGTKDFRDLNLYQASSTLEITGVKINSTNTQLYMRKNIISGNRSYGLFIANADFVLTGNAIGTGVTGTERLGNGRGISVEVGAGGTIGGVNPEHVNKIGYNDYGIESVSSRPVTITRNSMFCNKFISIGKTINSFQPFVQILKKVAGNVSGRATPNAVIELFYTINCEGLCEGRTYYRTVQARSDGTWDDDQAASANVTATASLLNATTSPFSTAELLPNEEIIKHVTCNGLGSITIPEPRVGFTFTWNKILSNGIVFLGNAQQITNQDIGDYEVTIDDGCKAVTKRFVIKDQKLTDPILTPPPTNACGQMTFPFKVDVLRGFGIITYQFLDAAGVIVASGIMPATGGVTATLPEGTYKVIVKDEAGCSKVASFTTVTRKPSPIIRFTLPSTAAACGQRNGAITGVVVDDATNPKYKWYTYDMVTNTRGTTLISEDADLTGAYGGYYVLVVSDDGGCPPVASSPRYIGIYDSVIINIPLNTKPATCNLDNGGINGITIVEANFYELFSPTGQSVKKAAYAPNDVLSFSNLPSGRYRLNGLNTVTGCTKDGFFTINRIEPTVYDYTANALATTCGLINGSITIRFANNSPLPVSYEWRDVAGTLVPGAVYTEARTIQLPGLSAGTYSMTVYDVNGCTVLFGPYTIRATEILTIDNTTIPPTNDGCSLSRGAVTGLLGRGGIQPYAYTWKDENGRIVRDRQTTPDLTGVPEGKYRMFLYDATACGEAISDVYVVENPSFNVATPATNKRINVCYATEITVKVLTHDEGTYQLYKEVTDGAPIMENTTGVFVFKVSKTGDYQIRRKLGSCYSEFTSVHVEVTNDNMEIKNTMTPNGDGINDYWMVTGLPDQADINIKVYTRSGQLVYESTGPYNKPFDGRFRGVDLPAGVYYYKIDLRADCNPIGGSITLLR